MLRPNWNEHVNELSHMAGYYFRQALVHVLLRNIYFVGPYLRVCLRWSMVIPSSLEL